MSNGDRILGVLGNSIIGRASRNDQKVQHIYRKIKFISSVYHQDLFVYISLFRSLHMFRPICLDVQIYLSISVCLALSV